MHHINGVKEKHPTGFSQLMKKSYLTISTPFMMKTFTKLRKKGNFFNIIQAMYEKPTAKIKLNGERLKGFSRKSGTRQGCPILPLSFNIELEVLTRAETQEKEIKMSKLERKK